MYVRDFFTRRATFQKRSPQRVLLGKLRKLCAVILEKFFMMKNLPPPQTKSQNRFVGLHVGGHRVPKTAKIFMFSQTFRSFFSEKKRNIWDLKSRDPLSYIFCIVFTMRVLNSKLISLS